jgi:5-methylcytosine-specific restriction enzyme A
MPSKIPTHRPIRLKDAGTRLYDRTRRDDEARRFYQSRPWRELRLLVLARRPLCQDCERKGLVTPAVDVHHEVELRDRPDLGLVESNLTPLCKPCHNARRPAPYGTNSRQLGHS